MSTEPNFTYTLVGYREDGIDTCRGCEMGRSSSDFFLSVHATADEAATEWARRLFAEEGRGREYCAFEYTLLLDGRDRDHDPSAWDEGTPCNPQTGASFAEEARDAVAALVAQKLAQLKADKLAADERALQAKQAQELARRARQKQEQEAAERAEYQRLSAKFAGPGA
jgi:hypothetical protein